MLRRFITRAFYQELKKNLIENFGIKTPEVQRNLRYSFCYSESLIIMRLEPSGTLLIQKPENHVLLIQEPLLLFQETNLEDHQRTREL